ncbi:glucuronate isomerase [Actinoplanes sp. NPDC023714]|uniref:glucuronate isomerase n=1 Tax=Actinoplanes sp. NPDC023714 TaxID=3154322 RepID=UPI00340AC748
MSDSPLHPDRALPADPVLRPLAREIFASTRDLPIVSMHGHVDAAVFAADEPFADPAALFVTPDHYLVRMLLSRGVPHDALGVPRRDGRPVETDPRAIWRTFAAHWRLFRGTPTRFWLEHELAEVFGIPTKLSAETADDIYDRLCAKLAEPRFRPLALLDAFRIEIISTTDAATASLAEHRELAGKGWGERIVPTFRPDALLDVAKPGWPDELRKLGDITAYDGYITALEERRAVFKAAGARATDHGHLSADTTPLDIADARRLFRAALDRTITDAEAAAFLAHMLFEMARMSTEDGLTMQIHPGVLRDHDPAVLAARGPDVGYDIPVHTPYARPLRPLLNAFGHHPNLRVIVFTVDETAFSRELAPLAGVYPAMLLGAPWWFLDTPDGMRRFREAVTDTAGFANTAGFVDDTRAFLSIPARHDLARRIDAGHLARLVAEHRLDLDEALETARDLAYDLPRAAYPKPGAAPASPPRAGTAPASPPQAGTAPASPPHAGAVPAISEAGAA